MNRFDCFLLLFSAYFSARGVLYVSPFARIGFGLCLGSERMLSHKIFEIQSLGSSTICLDMPRNLSCHRLSSHERVTQHSTDPHGAEKSQNI